MVYKGKRQRQGGKICTCISRLTYLILDNEFARADNIPPGLNGRNIGQILLAAQYSKTGVGIGQTRDNTRSFDARALRWKRYSGKRFLPLF